MPCDVSWVHKRLGFDLVSCYLLIHVNFFEFTYLELYFLWSKSMKESSSFVSIVGLVVSQLNGHQQNTKLISKERFTCKYIHGFILSKSRQIQSYIRTEQTQVSSTFIIKLKLSSHLAFVFSLRIFWELPLCWLLGIFYLSNLENGAFFKPKKSDCVLGITSHLIEIPLPIKF